MLLMCALQLAPPGDDAVITNNLAWYMQIQKNNGVKYMPGTGPAVPQHCPETGANFLMGGPFWADPIHNMDWVQGILKSVQVIPPRIA